MGRGHLRAEEVAQLAGRRRAAPQRYELYAFTGTYDPITHEALCADCAFRRR